MVSSEMVSHHCIAGSKNGGIGHRFAFYIMALFSLFPCVVQDESMPKLASCLDEGIPKGMQRTENREQRRTACTRDSASSRRSCESKRRLIVERGSTGWRRPAGNSTGKHGRLEILRLCGRRARPAFVDEAEGPGSGPRAACTLTRLSRQIEESDTENEFPNAAPGPESRRGPGFMACSFVAIVPDFEEAD